MKKLLFRKLLLDYINFFIIALFSASIIIWVFQAVNYLDIMIEDGRDYLVYIKYSPLSFPKIISRLFPFILFFSLFYVTIKYETNNELMIFWNFGINKIEVVNFMIRISILFMFIQIIFSSYLVPKSQDLAKFYIRSSSINFFENFIKPQKFNDTIKGVTLFTEKKDNEGNLYNLYLKKDLNSSDFQLTYARRGEFKEYDNTAVLILYDGETITKKNDSITNFSFSKSDFPLNNAETNTTTYRKTQELSSFNLFKCLKIIKIQKKVRNYENIENCRVENLVNLYKEIYKRFIIPLYIPLLVLSNYILIYKSKENIEYNRFKILTFLIGILFIIFSETTIRLISSNLSLNLYIASFPLIAFIILYFNTFKTFGIRFKGI